MQADVLVMLYVAAALQVAAALVGLRFVVLGGAYRFWLVICFALVIQAVLSAEAAAAGAATLPVAIAHLAAALLWLTGVVAVFVRLRARFDRAADSAPDVSNPVGAAIVMLDPDGRVRSMNDAAKSLLRWEGRAIGGLDWFDTFVPEAQREERRAALRRFVEADDDHDEYVELTLQDAEGGDHTLVWHRRVLRDAEGKATGVRAAGVGMSDGEAVERELAFRSLLLDHTTDSIVAYRPDGTVVYANDTARAYRGAERGDLVGSDMRRLIPARDRDAFEIHLETVTRGSCVTFETEAVDDQGIVRPLESHACPVDIGGQQLIVDVARDITERREAESAIRRLAYTDHLTGLPNRVLLADRSAVAFARARRDGDRLALLFMDLDHVKYVNDTLGHAAGDDLLRQVGSRLLETFRGEDTVARIGGDEFVILAEVTGCENADALAGRVVDLVSEPYTIGGEEIYSSASVGVALFPDDGDALEDLIAKADAAMYVAKERGRGRFVRCARTDEA